MHETQRQKETVTLSPASSIVLFGLPGSGKTSLLEAMPRSAYLNINNTPNRSLFTSISGPHPFASFDRNGRSPLQHFEHVNGANVMNDSDTQRVTNAVLSANSVSEGKNGISIHFNHTINVCDPEGDVCGQILMKDKTNYTEAEKKYLNSLLAADTIVCALPIDARGKDSGEISAVSHLSYVLSILDSFKGSGKNVILALTKVDMALNLVGPKSHFNHAYLHVGAESGVKNFSDLQEKYPEVKIIDTSAAGAKPRGFQESHMTVRKSNYNSMTGAVDDVERWKPFGVLPILAEHLNITERKAIDNMPAGCTGYFVKEKVKNEYIPFRDISYL